MKKAICYTLGQLYAFFSGAAYVAFVMLLAGHFPIQDYEYLIKALLYIVLPGTFLIFLIRYNFAAANAFGKMRYGAVMTAVGVIVALGGAFVMWNFSFYPEEILLAVIIAMPFILYKSGRLIAKHYKKT